MSHFFFSSNKIFSIRAYQFFFLNKLYVKVAYDVLSPYYSMHLESAWPRTFREVTNYKKENHNISKAFVLLLLGMLKVNLKKNQRRKPSVIMLDERGFRPRNDGVKMQPQQKHLRFFLFKQLPLQGHQAQQHLPLQSRLQLL